MLFLAGLAVVAVVAGVTYGVVVALDVGTDDVEAASPAGAGEPPPETLVPLTQDQVAVTGVAFGVTAERARLDRVPTPLQVTVAAGAGGATLHDVAVDAQPSEIVWDGGRPFDLHGEGLGILPQSVGVVASPTTVTVTFADGDVHGLVPGSYGLQTPVAVGSLGVARPFDAVAFGATVESTVAFRGGASTSMLPRRLEMEGPGRVVLHGMLEVRRPDGATVATASVELPEGPFELTITPRPDGSGYDVDAVLQGAVQVT